MPPELERRAALQLSEAEALGESYGVPVFGRIVRTRNAGRALIDEAVARGSEVIVLGTPGRSPRSSQVRRIGRGLRAAPRDLQGHDRRDPRMARARARARRAGGAAVSGRTVYRSGTALMSIALIAIGAAAIVRTAAAGATGPAVGYLLGAGLLAAGVLRLVILRRTG